MGIFSWIRCRVFLRHRYYVSKAWTDQCRELRCFTCNKHWMMHDRYQAVLPFDHELEDLAKMEADPSAWFEGRKATDLG